jgi:hypothetical protein
MATKLRVLSLHLSDGTQESQRNISLDSWSPGRDLNSRHPEYEAGVIPTET